MYYYSDKEELEALRKENREVRLMANKKNKEITYTKDQVRSLVADVLVEVIDKLKDPSLVIAGMLACDILDKKLK